jgi:hypothetical protein
MFILIPVIFIAISFSSCSRKIHPSGSPSVTPIQGISSTEKSGEEISVEKTSVKRMPKATFPKIISVNDSAASKSVDGRLYYDVMGHRYWKNYKDGKYYLFSKSMYNNPDFKKE